MMVFKDGPTDDDFEDMVDEAAVFGTEYHIQKKKWFFFFWEGWKTYQYTHL